MHISWLTGLLIRLELTAVCEGEQALILTKHFVCMVCPYAGENIAVFSLLSNHHNDPFVRPNDLILLITNCLKEYWPQIPTWYLSLSLWSFPEDIPLPATPISDLHRCDWVELWLNHSQAKDNLAKASAYHRFVFFLL